MSLIDKSAFLLSVGIGILEVYVWLEDPLHVHKALNDGIEMEFSHKVLAASINGAFHFIVGLALLYRIKYMAAFSVPFSIGFTFNQWIFWWWPYLLGDQAGTAAMVAEHRDQLKSLPTLLPSLHPDGLVPDIEHTILQPISLLCLLFVVLSYKKLYTRTWLEIVLFIAFTLLLCLLPIFLIYESASPAQELGPILVLTQTLLCGLYVLFTSNSAPQYEKSFSSKKKK